MSVLEKIRQRQGLLVGIIAVALVVFILQSALNDRTGRIFSGQDTEIGEIDGESVDYKEFAEKVKAQELIYAKNKRNVDEKTREEINNNVWNQLFVEKVYNKEIEKAGVKVSDEELNEIMLKNPNATVQQALTDNRTGKVYDIFLGADGKIDIIKLNKWVKDLNRKDEQNAQMSDFWESLEKQVKETRTIEKYNNLIKKGFYVTASQAKREYLANATSVNIKYVVKRYNTIADSTVKVSDDDARKYYNEHPNEFKNADFTRRFDYVAFDVAPSPEDIMAIRAEAQKVADDWKTKTAKEDTVFLQQNLVNTTESPINYFTKKTLSPSIDSGFATSPVGTIAGPYMEGNFFKVSRLLKTKSVNDSAKVRHILVSFVGAERAEPTVKMNRDQAKKFADSLLATLKSGKGKFADYVTKYSTDPGRLAEAGKPGNGGIYGYFGENSGFVKPFEDMGLEGKKGDLKVVETTMGFHIMELIDTKGSSNKFLVATVSREIEPSSKTSQEVYSKATAFAGNNTTGEKFEKAIIDGKLNKRPDVEVRSNDKTITGLESPKELVKWAFEAKKDAVSEAFTFGNKIVVAHLTAIKDKGIAPFEQVIDQAKLKAITAKKGEMIVAEYNTKAGNSKNIDEIAAKLSLAAEKMENLNFMAYAINGVGREDKAIGIATSLKAGELSKPIIGENGVLFVYVEKVNPPVEQIKDNYKEYKKQQASNYVYRVENETYSSLHEKANIKDNRFKFNY